MSAKRKCCEKEVQSLTFGYTKFLKVITTASTYIKLVEPTPVTKWVKWTKFGQNLDKNWPKQPILKVETQNFWS